MLFVVIYLVSLIMFVVTHMMILIWMILFLTLILKNLLIFFISLLCYARVSRQIGALAKINHLTQVMRISRRMIPLNHNLTQVIQLSELCNVRLAERAGFPVQLMCDGMRSYDDAAQQGRAIFVSEHINSSGEREGAPPPPLQSNFF